MAGGMDPEVTPAGPNPLSTAWSPSGIQLLVCSLSQISREKAVLHVTLETAALYPQKAKTQLLYLSVTPETWPFESK